MESKVLLLDDLGKKYGETHVYYNLKTPAEAIKLLCINYPEFAKDVFKLQEQGIFYKVQQVDIDLELSDLFLPLGSHDLVITPVISGSGDLGKIAVGVGLFALGMATGGVTFGSFFKAATVEGSFAAAGYLTKAAITIGGALVLQGVSDMLFPLPQPQDFNNEEDPRISFSFSGVQNTSRAGTSHPIAYGEIVTGSVVISAGIDTNQVQA